MKNSLVPNGHQTISTCWRQCCLQTSRILARQLRCFLHDVFLPSCYYKIVRSQNLFSLPVAIAARFHPSVRLRDGAEWFQCHFQWIRCRQGCIEQKSNCPDFWAFGCFFEHKSSRLVFAILRFFCLFFLIVFSCPT